MAATRRQIFESLASLLESLPWAKKVEYEKIRTSLTELRDHEVPYIQFYDTGATNEHQKGLVEIRMSVAVELILRQTQFDIADQGDLADKMEAIETLIGDNPQLGLAGVRHVIYDGYATDLHTVQEYFLGILQFTIVYMRPYGVC